VRDLDDLWNAAQNCPQFQPGAGRKPSMLKQLSPLLVVLAVSLPSQLQAQQASWPANAPIKRTPLQKFDVPGTNYETVIGLAEIAPNANIGRHPHPGMESGYVLVGDFVLLVEGQPDKPLKAGESYQVPAGAAHDGKAGEKGGKVIATYVVEKGKPLASPAP
jgi:quercetin dioxygenase-like cupin family protein